MLLYPEYRSSNPTCRKYHRQFANYCQHLPPTTQVYPHPILFKYSHRKNLHHSHCSTIVLHTTHRVKDRSTRRIQSITHHWISYFRFGTISITIVILQKIDTPRCIGCSILLLITQRTWSTGTCLISSI